MYGHRLRRESSHLRHYEVKLDHCTLGRKLGKRMPLLAKAVAGLDPVSRLGLRAGMPITVDLGEGAVELVPGDLDVRIQQREGTVSSYDEALLVALDTELDEDLLQEGLAREVIEFRSTWTSTWPTTTESRFAGRAALESVRPSMSTPTSWLGKC